MPPKKPQNPDPAQLDIRNFMSLHKRTGSRDVEFGNAHQPQQHQTAPLFPPAVPARPGPPGLPAAGPPGRARPSAAVPAIPATPGPSGSSRAGPSGSARPSAAVPSRSTAGPSMSRLLGSSGPSVIRPPRAGAADVRPAGIARQSDRTPATIFTALVARSQVYREGIILRSQSKPITTQAITQGQEGFVLRDAFHNDNVDNAGNQWVRWYPARESNKNKFCFVLMNALKIGQLAQAAKLVNIYPPIMAPPPGSWQDDGSVLARTIVGLCNGIAANSEEFRRLGLVEGLRRAYANNARAHLQNFCAGMPRAIYNIMKDGDFTIDRLWDLPRTSPLEVGPKDLDKRAVIYLQIWKMTTGYKVRIGRSIEAGRRRKEHESAMIKAQSWANRKAAGTLGADEPYIDSYLRETVTQKGKVAYRMMVLTDLAKRYPDQDIGFMISEMTGVMLFKSWSPNLHMDAINDDEQGTSSLYNRTTARISRDVCNTVFPVSGWQTPDSYGVNVLTPCFESQSKFAMWTLQHYYNEVVDADGTARMQHIKVYKCVPKTVQDNGRDDLFFVAFGTNETYTLPKGLKKFGLVAGTPCWPIFEIYQGNDTHPIPYAGLPQPAAFSDFREINQLGVYVQWYVKIPVKALI